MATQGIRWQEKLRIDDPVGAFPTHALASVWGLVATALFCEPTEKFTSSSGLVKGGSWKFLGVQILAILCCSAWAAITTFLLLYVIDKTIGIRMSEEEEEVGADYYVHDIKLSQHDHTDDQTVTPVELANHCGPDLSLVPISNIDKNMLQEINPCVLQRQIAERSISAGSGSKSDASPNQTRVDLSQITSSRENNGYETN